MIFDAVTIEFFAWIGIWLFISCGGVGKLFDILIVGDLPDDVPRDEGP